MRVQQVLPEMRLGNHVLPWVDKIIHLGNIITNKVSMLDSDMDAKKGRYVGRSIEINQEFSFAASETKIKINNIYNSSWFGSVLWDLFCPAAVKIESAYNRSMKVALKLHYATHRELIEPLSQSKHVKTIFMKRFLQLIESIRSSSKPILRSLLSHIQFDTRSTTGRNLRNIMLLLNKCSICDITAANIDNIQYCEVIEDRRWRVEPVQHLLVEREEGGLEEEDLEWLEWLCTN